MLEIIVPGGEMFDESTMTFSYSKETTLRLEHSLLSISKWESKWHKPYLTNTKKTEEEILDYIKCMSLNSNINDNVYINLIKNEDLKKKIADYIDNPMTATTFYESKKTNGTPSRKIITSEIIYARMIAFNIPVQFEKWHINRLLTLLTVVEYDNQPNKKMSKNATMKRNAELNAMRRAKHKSKG